MTDGLTDGQTELRWLRRAIAVPAVARKNHVRALAVSVEVFLHSLDPIVVAASLAGK